MSKTIFTTGDNKMKMPIRQIKKIFLARRSGFTIAELLIAIGIFVTLATVASGTFIQGLRSHRKLVDLMAVTDNAGIVLEQMTREIRTGYGFPPFFASAPLSFVNHDGNNVSYGWDGSKIMRNGVALTAPNVLVSNLKFVVSQSGGNKCNPWRITILMTVGSDKVSQTIPLETTVSSRVLPREAPGAVENIIFDCAPQP